jgi:signal peptidase I
MKPNKSHKKHKIESFLLLKRGLFLVPIIFSFIVLKLFPTVLVWLLPLMALYIIYRTIRVKGNKFKVFGMSFLISILSLFTIRTFVFQARYVANDAMSPFILRQERMFIDNTSYMFSDPNRGDIVLFDSQNGGDNIFSRVIGLPGETIEIKNGKIYINGKIQAEPFLGVKRSIYLNSDNPQIIHIPQRSYFIISDSYNYNDFTQNSISISIVRRNRVIGKIVSIFYPFNKMRQL